MHRRRDGGRAIFPLLLDALTSPQQYSSSYQRLLLRYGLRESPAQSRNLNRTCSSASAWNFKAMSSDNNYPCIRRRPLRRVERKNAQ